MNEQHTPGPWIVHPHSILAYVVPAAHAKRPIGGAADEQEDLNNYAQDIVSATFPDRHRSDAEVMANIRLIAAAPDLLAACQALVSYDESDDANGLLFMQKYADAVNKARAAIARALPQGDPK